MEDKGALYNFAFALGVYLLFIYWSIISSACVISSFWGAATTLLYPKT